MPPKVPLPSRTQAWIGVGVDITPVPGAVDPAEIEVPELDQDGDLATVEGGEATHTVDDWLALATVEEDDQQRRRQRHSKMSQAYPTSSSSATAFLDAPPGPTSTPPIAPAEVQATVVTDVGAAFGAAFHASLEQAGMATVGAGSNATFVITVLISMQV